MAGLDVLFARRLTWVGALLGFMMIAGVIFVLLNGSALALDSKPEVKTESFVVEVGDTTSVNFDLKLSTHETVITALTSSSNLLEAQITHFGEVEFTVTGSEEKKVNLKPTGSISPISLFLPELDGEPLVWTIGLNPDVPFDLNVDASTGRSELNLTDIRLKSLYFDGSTGASRIVLPMSKENYQVRLDASTGALEVVLPAESNLTLYLNGSTGGVEMDVPEAAAVRVEVLSSGLGKLQLPQWITKVRGLQGEEEGVYQSAGFDAAPYQMIIVIEDIGTGNILIN